MSLGGLFLICVHSRATDSEVLTNVWYIIVFYAVCLGPGSWQRKTLRFSFSLSPFYCFPPAFLYCTLDKYAEECQSVGNITKEMVTKYIYPQSVIYFLQFSSHLISVMN